VLACGWACWAIGTQRGGWSDEQAGAVAVERVECIITWWLSSYTSSNRLLTVTMVNFVGGIGKDHL